ncbi:Zinc finger mym-type protein 1-like protein [Caligus rogercresseyi]|uniref:Zinc finger mym-type protein 1-like protein n=1 Tax=Caligus rogercresseyi TaxID=217165 RepID=A0A7T8GQA0_CALRO|nr:Zinc finger mym-type protein 1-like protein [Caligus rogercresseyi]
MAQLYEIKKDDLLAEMHQMRRLLERKKEHGETVSSTLEFLSMLKPYKDSFEDIYKLLRISVTLPVTSASCERSFSCMRRVKPT